MLQEEMPKLSFAKVKCSIASSIQNIRFILGGSGKVSVAM